MERKFRKIVSIVTIVVMIAAMMPVAALASLAAADGDDVLTGLTHVDVGNASRSSNGFTYTFTVPYKDSSSPLVLDGKLSFTHNQSVYTDVVLSLGGTTSIAVPGSAALTVTFYPVERDAGPFTTTYTIAAVAAPYNPPQFSGNISKTVSGPGTLSFLQADFTNVFQNNDSAGLSHISISGMNPTSGKLTYGSGDYVFGTKIAVADIGNLKFAANAVSIAANVSYNVTGYYFNDDSNSEASITGPALNITVTPTTPDSLSLGKIKHSERLNFSNTIRTNLSTICNTVTAQNLDYITFTSLPTAGQGVLYINYGVTGQQRALTTADKIYCSSNTTVSDGYHITAVTFVPTAKYNGTVTMSYKAVAVGGAEYTASMTLTVVGEVSYSTDTKTPIKFSASAFNAICGVELGTTLDSVKFTLPGSNDGSLRLDYVSSTNTGSPVNATTSYYNSDSSTPNISSITFVPPTTAKTVTISYTATSGSSSYTGQVVITVALADPARVVYETDGITPVQFNASHFNTASVSATGRDLTRVQFTSVTSSYGRLYYNYVSSSSNDGFVNTGTDYYNSSSGSNRLGLVYFVPNVNATNTVTFSYTGYNNQGVSFIGTVVINITKANETTVKYETDNQTPLSFSAASFNTASNSATGSNLSYIRFSSLPSTTSQGTLYYNYNKNTNTGTTVSTSGTNDSSTNNSYYYSASSSLRSINDLTFVPRSSYTGTVTFNYSGVATNGATFTGTVQIVVSPQNENAITYSVSPASSVKFDDDDFNAVCKKLNNNRNLDYVMFTLPSTSQGRLYLNYVSSSSTGTAVSASTSYYRSGTPAISNISFVPTSGYLGKVTINYIGYDTNGNSFNGQVIITVENKAQTTVYYSAQAGETITFVPTDFQNACLSYTGANLNYVTFTLPSTTYGTLYQNYGTSSSAVVSSGTRYYRSGTSPLISTVSFVPRSGYSGAVTINYAGVDANGTSYSGKVEIFIYNSGAANIAFQTMGGAAVAFDAASFNSACSLRTGAALDYVTFTLPSTTYGVLYYDYVSSSNYGSLVSSATRYGYSSTPGVGRVTFVPVSGFVGPATIYYTGYNVNGHSYTGTITVTLARASKYFTDVTIAYSWASAAIDTLYEKGVVTGVGNNRYNPAGNITRGDFMLMLYRALDLKANTSGTSQFSDVPKGSYYHDAILVAKALGIALGDNNRFRPNEAITRQDAMVLTIRVLNSVGKNLSKGTMADLNSFSDRNQVADYAVEAVATLVKAKLIQGSGGKINPTSNMTRAEMAVFLDRVLKI